ncbi:hypothetical protein OKW30_007116 [Paraburkholderia sp. Clong3]
MIAQDDGDGSRRGERALESERQRYEERRDEHRGYQKKRSIFDVFDFD